MAPWGWHEIGIMYSQQSVHNGWIRNILCEMVDERPQAIAARGGPQLLKRQRKVYTVGNIS